LSFDDALELRVVVMAVDLKSGRAGREQGVRDELGGKDGDGHHNQQAGDYHNFFIAEVLRLYLFCPGGLMKLFATEIGAGLQCTVGRVFELGVVFVVEVVVVVVFRC